MILNLIDNRQYLVKVEVEEYEKEISLNFSYNEYLKDEIKAMDGARWNPKNKAWTIKNTERNWVNLLYLKGEDVYHLYDKELIEFKPSRDCLRDHQKQMLNQALTRRKCILACEMGTGKTLVGIETMELASKMFGLKNWWWIGPKSANVSVEIEFYKWDSQIRPRLMTYEYFRLHADEYPIPDGIIFDESSRLKTITSKRTQKAIETVNRMSDDSFCILLSGTPAPKSPVDWYSQVEMLAPGFIREGNVHKFKHRLCLSVQEMNATGTYYPRLITWLDDKNKCAECGELKEKHYANHPFINSINEVAKLYDRLKGLVTVIKKEDCLDLPDKQYRIVKCEPSKNTTRLMRALSKKYERVVDILNYSRQLSDGFQYVIEQVDSKTCPKCNGNKVTITETYPENTDMNMNMNDFVNQKMVKQEIECFICNGSGEVPIKDKVIKNIKTPKDDALKDLLDEYSETGRVVIYAGYTASVDNCVKIARSQGWIVIRVDGRGWEYSDLRCKSNVEAIKLFQDKTNAQRIAFIGNPGASCFGLTLTASRVVIYFSNSFSGEHRAQSEDRIHRVGMDINLGATIIDIIHLPTDQFVLDNLKKKKRLQDLSLGELYKYLQREEKECL